MADTVSENARLLRENNALRAKVSRILKAAYPLRSFVDHVASCKGEKTRPIREIEDLLKEIGL